MFAPRQWPSLASIEIPPPRCDALAMMGKPPKWQRVFTVPNLDSFTNFLACYATEQEVQELIQLPVVYHYSNWDGIAQRIPIGVSVAQCWTPLPSADCLLAGCPRCVAGAGGYAFSWVDPRWTPEAALDLTQTMEEMRAESALPWPRGILQPPLPARAPAQFLTTMWEFPSPSCET